MKTIQVSKEVWHKITTIRKEQKFIHNNAVIEWLLIHQKQQSDTFEVTCPSCEHSFSIDKKCNKIKCPKCNFEGGVE